MKINEQVLQNIMRVARSGREFFAAACPRVNDAEVRTAFVYLAEVKSRFIGELAPWVTIGEAQSIDRTSPAAMVEKMYADARRNFHGEAPASVANALAFGEEQLIELVARAFEEASDETLKQLLKSYYAEGSLCLDAMARLQSRLAA